MRILQLCHKPPYPSDDGGSIAMHQITRGLLDQGIDVKVMALAPSGTHRKLDNIPSEYVRETQFESFPINTRVKALPAFLNLFTRESYNISRFYCKKFSERLGEVLKEEPFDIIQLEGLYLAPYIPVIRQHTGTTVLFRSHNIEHFIWERMAKTTVNPFKKLYLKILAARLKAFEMKTVHRVDGLLAISPVDLRFFEKNGFTQPSATIPVGMDPDIPEKTNVIKKNTVFHIGSMDWRPNQEGLKWFLETVWPLVTNNNRSLHFVLAGKNIPDMFYQYQGERVTIAGEVPDALEFMQSNQLMVVPLRSGGGMRVKIIEGMAAGKTIVSTSIGAEGIDCTHGENILLADTPQEMADAILFCFSNQEAMKEIGDKARSFANERHAMKPIIDKLLAFYRRFYATE